MDKITPFLWFERRAEEAAAFYTSLFPGSRVDAVHRAPGETPSGPAGMVLTVEFTLDGRRYIGLNGGRQFPFTEAFSLQVHCADQAEVDRLWHALLADGGEASMCGWLKDRYGLSWQITPIRLQDMLSSEDREAADRALQAMLTMQKIDLEVLERAFAGAPA
jgi:predicted 3-demethylubiquinone-9 3-methyltransferase (glyoxalase superfamily)